MYPYPVKVSVTTLCISCSDFRPAFWLTLLPEIVARRGFPAHPQWLTFSARLRWYRQRPSNLTGEQCTSTVETSLPECDDGYLDYTSSF
jgi:hypothetical protein